MGSTWPTSLDSRKGYDWSRKRHAELCSRSSRNCHNNGYNSNSWKSSLVCAGFGESFRAEDGLICWIQSVLLHGTPGRWHRHSLLQADCHPLPVTVYVSVTLYETHTHQFMTSYSSIDSSLHSSAIGFVEISPSQCTRISTRVSFIIS